MDGLFIDERILQLKNCNPLFFNQSLEDGQLKHVAYGHLGLPSLVFELHLQFHEFEGAEEATFGRWFANEFVEDVQAVHHIFFICDGQVERLAILSYE